MQLEQRTCLVTGATGGIGRALCAELAEAGARLVLSARSADRLDALRATLPEDRVVDVIAADQLQLSDIRTLADGARQHHVDTLVNLSGVNRLAFLEDLEDDELCAMINLNLLAPMRLTRLMLPQLRAHAAALIVNVGSAFGAIGYPGYTAYCASKFGLRGFNEALRRELQDAAIDVVYVAPRATATAMNSPQVDAMNAALGNHCDAPEWVATQICKAMQKRTRSAVFGWPEKFFVKFNQLLPGVVDTSLLKQLPVIRRHAGPTT